MARDSSCPGPTDMADATNGNLDEVKRALLTGLRYLLGFLHACAKILQQAVVVSTPVIRRLLFLSLKMFSSIISKLKSAVSSKESGEVVEEKERVKLGLLCIFHTPTSD